MSQLSRVSWMFLLASSISHTSGSDAQIKKEVKIVWSLSVAICAQRSVFEKNKKLEPPLKELAPYRSQGKQLCSHIARTNCAVENLDCKRKFQCRKSDGLSAGAGAGAGPRTGSNIIVRMKREQKCDALSIPCNNDTGCTIHTRERAFQFQVKSVADSLRSHATETQASVLSILKSGRLKSAALSIDIEQLWITNELVIKGASLGEVQELLKGHNDVAEVRPEHLFKIPELTSSSNLRNASDYEPEEDWNIKSVGADRVWAEGVTGKGIIVGHLDSGVFGRHEALKNNFRGEYGWFDPYSRTEEPYDDRGHRTHTLGTAVVETRGLGVAPGATWMSCKAFSDGGADEGALKACAQWILCPTKADGTEPDCSKAPHVVNNSWGQLLDPDESLLFESQFEEIIRCWRAAGIIPVFSTGNSGDACGTAYWPGLLDSVISVGGVETNFDPNLKEPFRASYGSSRGPPHPSYAQVIKPDVSSPGGDILSASFSGEQDYVLKSGTSQAAPLVTGTIALLLEKHPSLKYDQVLAALAQSCSTVVSLNYAPDPCGNISVESWPNNHLGFGMVNAYKAVFGGGEVDCND